MTRFSCCPLTRLSSHIWAGIKQHNTGQSTMFQVVVLCPNKVVTSNSRPILKLCEVVLDRDHDLRPRPAFDVWAVVEQEGKITCSYLSHHPKFINIHHIILIWKKREIWSLSLSISCHYHEWVGRNCRGAVTERPMMDLWLHRGSNVGWKSQGGLRREWWLFGIWESSLINTCSIQLQPTYDLRWFISKRPRSPSDRPRHRSIHHIQDCREPRQRFTS